MTFASSTIKPLPDLPMRVHVHHRHSMLFECAGVSSEVVGESYRGGRVEIMVDVEDGEQDDHGRSVARRVFIC